MIKQRGKTGKKSTLVIDGGVEGWDRYKDLTTDKDRKQWRIKLYSDWYVHYRKKDPNAPEKFVSHGKTSVDLFTLAKSKQAAIDSFIQKCENYISLFEAYKSILLKYVIKAETK